ncbi:hypothetical protein DUI87_06754 [Hirundo rustica rustica]|uniref:Uncharacterized protein n=1 Tax=Hirundo rustica rustica TaxID=333673 RepID=A0A3M0KTH1_HIRRU|nr:hypothetical protein DUI87_06754 [Hirundo rustica rustica]
MEGPWRSRDAPAAHGGSMEEQRSTCSPWRVHGGAEIRLQPIEEPTLEQVDAQRWLQPHGKSHWNGVLSGPVAPWGEELVLEQPLGENSMLCDMLWIGIITTYFVTYKCVWSLLIRLCPSLVLSNPENVKDNQEIPHVLGLSYLDEDDGDRHQSPRGGIY